MKDKDEQKRERQRQAKKRKALSRIRKALSKAELLKGGQEFSDWENEFAQSLEEKLNTFDSAFIDPEKGRPGEALSYRQAIKLKEIEDKAKGKVPKQWKSGNGFKNKNWTNKPKRLEDMETDDGETSGPKTGIGVAEQPAPPQRTPKGTPKLSVIIGGKK